MRGKQFAQVNQLQNPEKSTMLIYHIISSFISRFWHNANYTIDVGLNPAYPPYYSSDNFF